MSESNPSGISGDEQKRLESLVCYSIMDTPAEAVFDRLTRFAAALFDAPFAMVSLLDERRQWFKSSFGLDDKETPRGLAFCDHAIRDARVMVVADAREDDRFADNPLVTGSPGVRFYAGAPLVNREGHALGTLCVMDTRPRHDIDPDKLEQLQELAAAVLMQMEMRRALRELDESREALRNRETLLSRIYDSVETGIAIADGDGHIVEANAYFWRLVQQSRHAVIGRPLGELFTETDDATPLIPVEGQSECRMLTGAGERIDVAVAVRGLELGSGGRAQVIAVSDLRQQKMEERMAGMRAEILQRITGQAPLEDVLSDLCHMLEEQVPGTWVLVSRVDGDGLAPIAGPSLTGLGEDSLLSGTLLRAGHSLSASAAELATTILCEDVAADSRWPQTRELLLSRGIHAALAAPIRLTDGVVGGTVSIYWPEAGPIAERIRLIVEEYAELAAVAMVHASTVERLHFRAYHDSLTGLANRELFFDRVALAVGRARRNGGVVGVLMLDLDDFKLINDSLGHDVGDQLLLEAAQRLTQTVRQTDTVARLGGDEFALALETETEGQLTSTANKILRRLSGPAEVAGHGLRITPSIGVAVYPRDGDDARSLLKAADTAMYEVKRSGKRGLRIYDAALAKAATDTFALIQDLSEAIQTGRLIAHLQPRLDLESGAVLGVKAYARWPHPTQGIIPAARFLAVAEQAGLLPQVDDLILEAALPQLAAARRTIPELRLHWNLSVASLQRGDFVDRLQGRLNSHGLPPESLQLELVEAQLHRSLQRNVGILADIRRQLPGLRVGLDDFGITHGAIASLHELQLDSLTVDRSFTARLGGDDPRGGTVSRTLITTLVHLARDLELDLVVEGVESQRQLRELLSLGCRLMQGDLFSPPTAELDRNLADLGRSPHRG